MNKDWTENIKQRIDHHTMAEPDGLWQSLESQLGIEAESAKEKKPQTAILWFRRCGIAAAVAALAVVGYTLLRQSDIDITNTPQYAETPNADAINSNNTTPAIAQESDAKVRVAMMLARAAVATETEHRQTEAELSGNSTNSATPNAPGKETSSQEDVQSGNSFANTQQSPTEKKTEKKYASEYRNNNSDYDLALVHKARNNRPIALSVGTSGLQLGNRADQGMLYVANDFMTFEGGGSDMQGNNTPNLPLRHKMPVNVGVKAKFHLTNRLFAEGGVSYSYLHSDGETASARVTQNLHYLGIPIDLGYVFWQNKRMKIYGTAGSECQKLVSGKLSTTYIVDNPVTTSESVTEKHLQWSVNASAGIEVGIIPSLSIYAEPGVKRYFNNGSSIDNIYKEKPTNFNLQVGLRLDL